jgi:hypothetical protein
MSSTMLDNRDWQRWCEPVRAAAGWDAFWRDVDGKGFPNGIHGPT